MSASIEVKQSVIENVEKGLAPAKASTGQGHRASFLVGLKLS